VPILHRSLWVSLAIFAAFAPWRVQAETVRLKSGEVVEGKIQQYGNGQITIAITGKQSRKIPQDQIVSIDFGVKPTKKEPSPSAGNSPPQIPPASPGAGDPSSDTFLKTLTKSNSKYKSPTDTFFVWRNAAVNGDIDGMADCYASYQQKDVKKQLKALPKDGREKMRTATARIQFIPAKPIFQGDRALLEVNWQTGLQSDTQVLQFVLEKNEWKLIQ